jgi:hypothetical protein
MVCLTMVLTMSCIFAWGTYSSFPFYSHHSLPLVLLSIRRAAIMPVVSLMLALDILVFVISIAAFFAIRDYQRRRGLPYPPGPRPLPLIGNLLDVPKESSWLAYTQLSKKHGMIYLSR